MREYWCKKYGTGACGTVHIDQRQLDEAARELVIAILSDERNAAAIEAELAARADEAGTLESLIAEAKRDAETMAERLGRKERTLAEYDAFMRGHDAYLADLRAKLAAMDKPGEPVPAWQTAGVWARRWDDAGPSERMSLLRQALRGRVLIIGLPDPDDPGNAARRITVSD
jgi:hypothetical protein